MKVEQLSLLDFFLLSEDKRLEYKTIYDNITFDVDCKKWLYKEVKETQYLLRNELTYKNIIDIVGIKIKGDLMLVRKFEDNTRSSVKETTEEKYNNRLYELINNLDAFLIEVLACSANMKVISVNYNFMQNVFAKSVDGVLCKLTFEG